MKYDRKRAVLFSLLKSLQVLFFGVFVLLFYLPVRNFLGAFANIMFGFSGLMCVVCIMADFAYKEGSTAGSKAKLHEDPVKETYGFYLGAVSSVIPVASALLLLISKLGLIGNFLPAYKILNAGAFPIMDLFAHDIYVKNMPWGMFILSAVLIVSHIVSTGVGFRLGYNKVDVKDKVVYKQK
ncbi:MAG: hypothetical protein IJ737_07440 [Ruminococcus sp.]|nr:hypothetical protein [Ruminococcus sp.]